MSQGSTSRRDMLSLVTLLGSASILGAAGASAAPKATEAALANWSKGDRDAAKQQLLAYLSQAAPQLLRPAEGVLTHPRLSQTFPGKQYSTNLWDWDTLWTTRALFRIAKLNNDADLRAQIGTHAAGSILNFLDVQSDEGRLPMVMDVKKQDPLGALPHDRPKGQNQAKPVFAQIAALVAAETGDVAWLAPYFDKLLRFYASWAKDNQSATGLFVWGNDVAIGNDNDPTTFGRPDYSSANLLLNCLFFEELKAAADLAGRLNRPDDQGRLAVQAKTLGNSIQAYCWDPRDQFYYTADVQVVDRRKELIPSVRPGMDTSWKSLPLRIQTFTGFLPLWCGLATADQAKALVQTNYLKDDRLRAPWGIRSLSNKEAMYSLLFSSNPSNWLGPVWIIANYLAWKGFKAYGFDAEARDLADKTIHLLANDLAVNGSLNEYYDPDTGKALSHKGFLNWNMLASEMIEA